MAMGKHANEKVEHQLNVSPKELDMETTAMCTFAQANAHSLLPHSYVHLHRHSSILHMLRHTYWHLTLKTFTNYCRRSFCCFSMCALYFASCFVCTRSDEKPVMCSKTREKVWNNNNKRSRRQANGKVAVFISPTILRLRFCIERARFFRCRFKSDLGCAFHLFRSNDRYNAAFIAL